jgi:hypothetical protein
MLDASPVGLNRWGRPIRIDLTERRCAVMPRRVEDRSGNSWRWFLGSSSTSASEQPSSSVAPDRRFERLAAVVRHLPAGPFTSVQYLDHAIGLNAVTNASDIAPAIDRLTALGIVRPHEDGDAPTWVVVD